MATPEPSTGPSEDDPAAPTPDSRPRVRTWIVIVLAGVALALGAFTVLLLVDGPFEIHPGSGTATITWTGVAQGTRARPQPQPFTGDIEGHPLSGTSTLLLPPETGVPSAATPAFRYQGAFAGNRFDLTVSFAFPVLLQPDHSSVAPGPDAFRITVAGSWGSSPIHATVISPSGAGPTASRPARFVGTIGDHPVTGTIQGPTGTGSHHHAMVTFTVG